MYLRLIRALSVCTVLLAPAAALAQVVKTPTGQYPNKPIRLIVAFAPGGTNDILARMVQRT